MPVPLIIPIFAAIGGGIVGALSRQPEINRLKKQVKNLQKQIEKLNKLVQEQDRQIKSLKMQVNGLKGYEKIKNLGRTKGAIMQQYAFKEYIDLCCELAKDKNITEQEQLFFNIYENMLNGIEVNIENKLFLKEYLINRYNYEIQQLQELDPKEIIRRVEETKVA